ncbi:MAG: zinc-binding protein [Candidatus Aenigmarchaeota archaeon]|nr:zinc-binding protein [Candidatus Aenigmarchaeota archaeon]NIP40408.1 zinc-binding protein [Candidatus Aenigmarchaeota archaeon]NIQ18334.1 zinc-binding protein [Candidatus Aenigmarchaeota archaeon]NIS73286.1 zinc-binding protein [Candidatus Aenigmarchaeota archaeon]
MREEKKEKPEEEVQEEEQKEEEVEEEQPAEEAAAAQTAEEAGKDKFGRTLYRVKCSDCGKETEVPFKPSGDRPVYCRDCYQKHRERKRF